MKKLVFLFAAIAMFGLSACDGGKTEKNLSNQDTDSLTEEDLKIANTNVAPGLLGDSTYVGIICQGTSQNVLVLCSANEEGERDTLTFLMDDDTDKTNCHGIIEGGTCEVIFSGELKEKPKVTYVETYATYANAIGRWIYTDPNETEKPIGLELKSQGKAFSNIPGFKVVAWQMYDDNARSIFLTISKNGAFDDVTAQLSEDGKTLTIEGDARVYTKEEK